MLSSLVATLAILASLAAPSRRALAEIRFEVVKSFERMPHTEAPLVLGSDGALYGSNDGGPAQSGTLFKVDRSGTFASLHTFSGGDGRGPSGALVAGSDGALYGVTASGGSSELGTVFVLDSEGTFTSLHSFDGTDGSRPYAALVLGSDGALYGTTSGGGSFGRGTVFRIDSSRSFTSLHSFSREDGAGPSAALVLASDGALYGTNPLGFSQWGQLEYGGTVFKIDPGGRVSPVHVFALGSAHPYSFLRSQALAVGSDGAIYGTANGGALGYGLIFKIDSEGIFTLLHSFSSADGDGFFGRLVLGTDGAIYGTARGYGWGCRCDYGTVFKIESDGTFTSLRSGAPVVWLSVGADGAVYGGSGREVFKIDSTGTVTSLQSDDGPELTSDPVLGSDGALYGFGEDAILKIDGAGTVASVHPFFSTDGAYPSSLLLGSDGTVYGFTSGDGSRHVRGALFRIDATGTFATVRSYDDLEDFLPLENWVLGGDGAFYGGVESYWEYCCVVWSHARIDTAGNFAWVVRDFFYPPSNLAVGSDGAIYGAASGGTFGYGQIFTVDSAGTSAPVHSFNGTDGAHPGSPLALGSDGKLYGTTYDGGSADSGTIFEVDSAGTFTLVHSFDGADGAHPRSPLASGSDGALYGVTPLGGKWDLGTVFMIDAAGTFISLNSIAGTDGSPGWSSYATLIPESDGALYGYTPYGGSENPGMIFEIDSAGTFSPLHSFSGADGIYPTGAPVVGSDGALYGTSYNGGSANSGTVFRVDSAGTFSLVHSFDGTDGAHPGSPLVLGRDGALYGTTWSGGPGGGGFVYRLVDWEPFPQSVEIDPLPDRTYGDPTFTVSATASSGLPVSFSASGSCSVAGDQVSITGVGVCTVTASQAGDSSYGPAPEVSREFNVTYAFSGFLRPVENPPSFNRVNAGRAVPIRFELGSDAGPDVIADGYPVVQRIDCATLAPLGEPEQARSAASSSLLHRRGTNSYTFLWKTNKRWAGSCRQFTLELDDGTEHRANFRFTSRHPSHRQPRRH